MNHPHLPAAIVDVQGSRDTRNLPIQRVGIKAIRHPLTVSDRSGQAQATVATCDLYVSLPAEQKGTHMSRFVEILNRQHSALSPAQLEPLLRMMVARLESEGGYLEIRFPFFMKKAAPVSGIESLLDYDVTLLARLAAGRYTQQLRVLVPITSLCPCSKEISDYGAHNQRSHVTVTATLTDPAARPLWVEDLIDCVEAEASAPLYGLLKRPDEKYVTEQAYDHPKFVEDLVRDIAMRLTHDARIAAYSVESENFESIHNHSAYARIDSLPQEDG